MRDVVNARASSLVRSASVALVAAVAAAPLGAPARAGARQDPAGAAERADPVAEIVKQFARHVYFRRVPLQRADGGEGFFLWVQAPSPADPKVATAARTYGPWIARLLEVFAARVEQPLGLVRRQDPAVVLLDSAGDYRNYVVSGATRNAPTSWSAWDPRAGLGVSHLGSFESGVPPYEKRGRVLRAVSLALLESHSERKSSTQLAPWLREGLADHLSLHYAADVETLGSPVVHREYLRTAIELTTDGALRELHWFSLETLAGLASTRHIADAAAARRRALGLPETDDFGRTYGAFFAQAHLWTHFLMDGDGGRHAPAFRRFWARALKGADQPADLRAAFEGVELASLEAPFEQWMRARYAAEFSRQPPPAAAASTFEAGAEPLAAPSFDPSTLGIPEDAFALRHARAVWRASLGELEAARKSLLALAEAAPEKERARYAAEAVRVAGLRDLRDAYLAGLAASDERLVFELEGQRLVARVEGFADGVLTLGRNNRDLEELRVTSIPPGALARMVGRDVPDGVPEWARFYGYVLDGDERWKRSMNDESAEAQALRADGDGYAALLELGRVAHELAWLADTPLPEDTGEAIVTVETLRRLMERHGEHALVAERLEPLGALAATAVGILVDAGELQDPLAVPIQDLGDGLIRLRYEFDDARELSDWREVTGHPQGFESAWDRTAVPEEEWGYVLSRGGLAFLGRASLRHVLPFSAPVAVRYELVLQPRDGDQVLQVNCFAGICLDAEGREVLANFDGSMYLLGTPEGRYRLNTEPFFLDFGHTYDVVLKHGEGDGVESWIDGKHVATLPAEGVTSGAVTLSVQSTLHARIESVQIEGRLDERAAAALREHAIRRQLAELGLHEGR